MKSYLADDSAADVENQKPKVMFVPAACGGGVSPALGLIADRCVTATYGAPASARWTASPANPVRLVGVEDGDIVGVGGTRPDGQDALDAGNTAAGEVCGVVRGAGGCVGAQSDGGQVRVDVVR